MPSWSGLHMCRTISMRALVACIQLDQLLVRQPLLGEVPERFHAQFQCLLGDHARPPLPRHAFADLVSHAGRNSRMSSTIPTSATRKMGAFGFLLMATMNGLPLMPARCWNDPLMPHAR